MSTIGYGDLTPKNQVGYAIVILLIMAVVSVFPFMISGIMDALAQAKGKLFFFFFLEVSARFSRQLLWSWHGC